MYAWSDYLISKKKVKSKKSKKQESFRETLFVTLKILGVMIVIFVFSRYKPLLILVTFEILDLIKNVIKHVQPFTPVDFVFIFGMAGSYYYSPIIGIVVFILGVLNRTFMLHIEFRHIEKAWRHIPLFFVVTLLRGQTFVVAATLMLVVNYLLKYVLYFFQGMPFDKVFFHVTNFTLSSLCFYLIHMFYFYLPFLA